MKKLNRYAGSSFSLTPSQLLSEGSEFLARLPSNYSPPILEVEGVERFQLIYSTDVNLTIRLRVKEFTRKQATLLAGQAIFKVSQDGISLGDWFILEFLYSYLLGSKQDSLYLKNSKELELSLLLKVILLSGTWMGLEGRSQLPQDILFLIKKSKWVPSERTYYSRSNLYRLNKFLEIRIVPIDDLIERSKGTIRYSSYCKGYGESSRMGRRQRTRPSSELDGEPVNLEKEEQISVPLQQIGQILQLVLKEIKYSKPR